MRGIVHDAPDRAGGLAPAPSEDAVIRVRGLTVGFGGRAVLDGLDLDVRRGEIMGVVGGSGTGKSVLLRTIIGLIRPSAGSVEVLGTEMGAASSAERMAIGRRWGVLFQQGALFSSLDVIENIAVPLREHTRLPNRTVRELARLKLGLVGLPPEAGAKFPSELSGGMIKRAALARALALDPEIVFLDEPTAGLDPIAAAEFDSLIVQLRDTLGLTVFMVTHDLDSLVTITDRVAVLGRGRMVVVGPLAEVRACPDPWVQDYFNGARGRRFAAS